MKKNIFLISIFINLFTGILTSSFDIPIDENYTEPINIAAENYLTLSFQNGTFYSWDQSDDTEQHTIGIFNTTKQSYLLDNFGVFWTLDYQINKFYRVSNQYGIAQIKYFQNEAKQSYINQNFIVKLENNRMTITSSAILSENFIFTVLNQNYIVISGIGLDLIQIDEQGALVGDINHLILPYDNQTYYSTTFSTIDNNSGIFIGNDQYFYLLKNITNNMTQTKLNLKTSNKLRNDVVLINSSNVILRNEKNNLYFVDVSQENPSINQWIDENENPIKSKTKNIAFAINDDSFILNITVTNSSWEYGTPYLIKTNNWNKLIEIANIETISNFILTNKNENKGIFLDKNLKANKFVYENDNFTIDVFGNLNNFQFVNNNLIFGTIQGNNLLITKTTNNLWAAMKNITFTTKNTKTNSQLLNNMIIPKSGEAINYQNTYFADNWVNINITNENLKAVTIESTSNKRILLPSNNNINYDFQNFDKHKIIIDFVSNKTTYQLIYKVNIINFTNKDLLQISSSTSTINSYVGISKNVLYNIKTINKNSTFIIDNYDYNYFQYAELSIYGDTKDMVVKNNYNLQINNEIKSDISEPNLFFGLKIVNLINQVNWIYLGFNSNDINPMTNFWDSKEGQYLMNKSLMHHYLERDLRKMNSQEIKQLMNISNNWYLVAIQGKAIIISIISIFGISFLTTIIVINYNFYLNRRIKIDQVEQNKILKNIIDVQ